tara:strand:+ start:1832 stop:2011 length:180 start_codon:yes stop_codon:yes gene_type:complete
MPINIEFDLSKDDWTSRCALSQLRNHVSIELSPITEVATMPLPGAIANFVDNLVMSTEP